MELIRDEKIRSLDLLFIEEEQYGFRNGLSTLNYLYQLLYDLKMKSKAKDSCIATFSDLEKAFDLSIDHGLLLHCLL